MRTFESKVILISHYAEFNCMGWHSFGIRVKVLCIYLHTYLFIRKFGTGTKTCYFLEVEFIVSYEQFIIRVLFKFITLKLTVF